jgi:hypothetical protein
MRALRHALLQVLLDVVVVVRNHLAVAQLLALVAPRALLAASLI